MIIVYTVIVWCEIGFATAVTRRMHDIVGRASVSECNAVQCRMSICMHIQSVSQNLMSTANVA